MSRIVLFFILYFSSFSLEADRERGDIYKDLNWHLQVLRERKSDLQRVYTSLPEQTKNEKIERAAIRYYNAREVYEKSKALVQEHRSLYPRDTLLLRVIEQKVEKVWEEITSLCVQITNLQPLDLYARAHHLQPGRLLRFRKFRNIRTEEVLDGADLEKILRKAWKAFHLRTKTTLMQAKELLKPVVEDYPDFLPAKFWLARVCFDLEEVEFAQELMAELIKKDPDLRIAKSMDDSLLSQDDLISHRSNPTSLPSVQSVSSPVAVIQKVEKEIMRVPFVFVIENSVHARPQSGLSYANTVMEFPAEGGITRYLAWYTDFNSLETPIGPIRSIRDYLIASIFVYEPFLVHCGGSPEGYRVRHELRIDALDQLANEIPFWRDSSRTPPHNLYTSMQKIQEIAYSRSKIPANHPYWFQYTGVGYPFGNPDTMAVHLPWYPNYTISWVVSSENSRWERKINGVYDRDASNKEILFTDNLLFLETKDKIIDNVGRRDVQVVGEGQFLGWLQKKKMSGFWQKPEIGSPLRFTDEEGKEILLVSGKTWVHFIPSLSRLKIDHYLHD